MMSYGLTNQVLVLFLELIGVKPTQIGGFMTWTLIGDALISFFLTLYADRIGRRVVLVMGTLMMLGAGIVFSRSTNFTVLLVAAIIGVISPSGDETGPFKSVEEACIAHLTPSNHLPEIFALHGLISTAGAAIGALFSGLVVDYFHETRGWDILDAYRSVFVIYAGVAVVKLIIMLLLSERCELGDDEEPTAQTETSPLEPPTEERSLLEGVNETVESGFSSNTKSHLYRLLAIFMLDSLGYGFMPSAWVIFYFKKFFNISATNLGVLFFITNSVDSFSSIPSAYFTKLLGPVKAILFTQAPSAVFFLLIGFVPQYLLAAGLLILYYLTMTMDVVPRQVLLVSIIPKRELSKALGLVNIGKTYARCVGPLFTGGLAERGKLHYGFFINGGFVLLADFILGTNFLHLDRKINDDLHKFQELQ